MKITNLFALPLALAADAVTLGEAGVTRRIFQDERNDQEIEAVKAIAKLVEAANKK
jgi:hypothetical protein